MNDIRELNDLSSEEIDAVSGGSIWMFFNLPNVQALVGAGGGKGGGGGEGGSQNDPFQQILQQLTGG